MADPDDRTDDRTGPGQTKTRRRTVGWVIATTLLLAVLQVGPSLSIIQSRGLWREFDWPGYIGFQAGSLAVPLAAGCLGLLFPRFRGPAFFLIALAVFVVATFGNLNR